MTDQPEPTELDVAVFKRGLCDYLRRLQAGEIDLIIRRYRKPVAVILSTDQMRLRREAREAQAALNAHLNARERHSVQRRRIRLHARGHWPEAKLAWLRGVPS